jgi:hypothetical protein
MRRARPAAVTTATSLDAPARALTLDATRESPPSPGPTPPPKPRAADRIREALQRWLEEDM